MKQDGETADWTAPREGGGLQKLAVDPVTDADLEGEEPDQPAGGRVGMNSAPVSFLRCFQSKTTFSLLRVFGRQVRDTESGLCNRRVLQCGASFGPAAPPFAPLCSSTEPAFAAFIFFISLFIETNPRPPGVLRGLF